MNWKSIILLLLGIGIIIFPKHIRYYRAYELGMKPTPGFVTIQRVTGVVFVILAVLFMIFDIE